MNQPPSPEELTSTIGFFLTLTSLLGTFFYIHLSNWFREILQLESKWSASDGFSDPDSIRYECRFELKRLLNHVPLLVSTAITIFMAAMVYIAWRMAASVSPRPAILDYYVPAFALFLVTYLGLMIYFLSHGYSKAFRLSKQIKAWRRRQRGR